MRTVLFALVLVCFNSFITCKSTSDYFANRELALSSLRSVIVRDESVHIPEYVQSTAEDVLFYRTESISPKAKRAVERILQKHTNETNVTYADIKRTIQEVEKTLLRLGIDAKVSIDYGSKCKDVALLSIKKKKIGKIEICNSGKRHEDIIRDYFSLGEGEEIDRNRLVADMDFLNNHFWQRGELSFDEDPNTNVTDITIKMNEEKAPFVSAGADNDGNTVDYRERFKAKVLASNILGSSHNISFLVASSTDFSSYGLFDVNYRCSFGTTFSSNIDCRVETANTPSKKQAHRLIVDSSLQANMFSNTAKAQRISLSAVYEIMNSDAFIFGRSDFKRNLSSLCFSCTIHGEKNFSDLQLKGDFSYFTQPFAPLNSMKQSRYNEYAHDASNTFRYFYTSLSAKKQIMEKTELACTLFGQYAFNCLPFFKKFSLVNKDMNSGFNENVFSVDSALYMQSSLSHKLHLKKFYLIKSSDFFEGGIFCNIGVGQNNQRDENGQLYIAVGPKFACDIFNIQSNLGINVLLASKDGPRRNPGLTFSLVSSY